MALEKDCFIHKNALTGIEPVSAFFLIRPFDLHWNVQFLYGLRSHG